MRNIFKFLLCAFVGVLIGYFIIIPVLTIIGFMILFVIACMCGVFVNECFKEFMRKRKKE